MTPTKTPLRIIDAVFRDPERSLHSSFWLKTWLKRSLYLAAALGLHVSAVFSLWIVQTPKPAPALQKQAPIEVALAPTQPPKSPPKPQPEPPPEPSAPPPPSVTPPALAQPQTPVQPEPPVAAPPKPAAQPPQQPSKPKPLAKAGRAITQTPKPSEPLDLSDPGIMVGDANAYAGGVTSPDGTSDTTVLEGPSGPVAPPLPAPAPPSPEPTIPKAQPKTPKHVHDLTRAVALEGGRWDCPWPAEADREQIDSQLVIIRVTVGPDGAPLSARVTRDPGFGFGPAAQACAMSRHYTPALDAAGQPTTAESPPIRVHFSRW